MDSWGSKEREPEHHIIQKLYSSTGAGAMQTAGSSHFSILSSWAEKLKEIMCCNLYGSQTNYKDHFRV